MSLVRIEIFSFQQCLLCQKRRAKLNGEESLRKNIINFVLCARTYIPFLLCAVDFTDRGVNLTFIWISKACKFFWMRANFWQGHAPNQALVAISRLSPESSPRCQSDADFLAQNSTVSEFTNVADRSLHFLRCDFISREKWIVPQREILFYSFTWYTVHFRNSAGFSDTSAKTPAAV